MFSHYLGAKHEVLLKKKDRCKNRRERTSLHKDLALLALQRSRVSEHKTVNQSVT